MNKTYFRQLLDLEVTASQRGSIIQTLYKDACSRVAIYLLDHEEDANLQNCSYAKKNLDFVKELLSIE